MITTIRIIQTVYGTAESYTTGECGFAEGEVG